MKTNFYILDQNGKKGLLYWHNTNLKQTWATIHPGQQTFQFQRLAVGVYQL